MICLGDLTFFDLADIDMLKYSEMAKTLSSDFSGMTNCILSRSEFYQNHDVNQENSFFHSVIKNKINANTSMLLICCVTEQSLPSAEAVDYCHKIRCYFHGRTNTDPCEELENRIRELDC
jgi:hypothetical protein